MSVFFFLSFACEIPSLHQCRWHNSLRDVKKKICVCLTLLRENQKSQAKTITDDLRFRVSISKMIFINFGFFITPFFCCYVDFFSSPYSQSLIQSVLDEKEALFFLSQLKRSFLEKNDQFFVVLLHNF